MGLYPGRSRYEFIYLFNFVYLMKDLRYVVQAVLWAGTFPRNPGFSPRWFNVMSVIGETAVE
jgi:hypothetical protein